MADSGVVGVPAVSSAAGSTQSIALAPLNEILVTETHGRLYMAARAGKLFSGGNQTAFGTATAAGLTATNTGGLILANPIGSGKNLVLEQFSIATILQQTVNAVGLGVGYSATVNIAATLTVVANQNALLNGPLSVGVLYCAASTTLPVTPYLARLVCTLPTGALTVTNGPVAATYDLLGSIILPPGGFCNVVTTAAGVASSVLHSFTWSEEPT